MQLINTFDEKAGVGVKCSFKFQSTYILLRSCKAMLSQKTEHHWDNHLLFVGSQMVLTNQKFIIAKALLGPPVCKVAEAPSSASAFGCC